MFRNGCARTRKTVRAMARREVRPMSSADGFSKDEALRSLCGAFEAYAGKPVPELERAFWSRAVTPQTIPRRELLLRMGDRPSWYYYLYQGLCRQFYLDAEGNDVTRGFAAEGEFCCTECHIQHERAAYSVETLEECKVLAFRFEDLKELQRSLYMKEVYIGALEKMLRRRMYREAGFTMENARDRYGTFCRLYPEYEARVRGIYLASYLGMTPENLSRIRRGLRGGAVEKME